MTPQETIWVLVDRDRHESITAVFPTELDALRALNGRGHGRVVELAWGKPLGEDA